MTPFAPFTGPALVLPEDDIDTDVIYPARFLLRTEKLGLGDFAFADRADLRSALTAARQPLTVIAGANFGCGSSREHAVWALAGLGIRAVFAPSFGEIFRSNCTNNGILAGIVSGADHQLLMAAAARGHAIGVDLEARTLSAAAGQIGFAIPDVDRRMLLEGWNATTRILAQHEHDIAGFEARQRKAAPWLWH